jgi:ribonuclease BN (tRNA processing enzyme)
MALTLTVLGSSDAFNSAGRGNACYLVRDREGSYCVDFGPTALRALKAAGREPADLDAVFLTHLHGDHFEGLSQLFIDAQYRAFRHRPLIIGGPKGTRRAVESLYKLVYGRAARKRPFQVRYQEWRAGTIAHAAGRRIETFSARHMRPSDGALSLKIRSGANTLAFSGDTGWSTHLPLLAEGVDALVVECTELHGEHAQHLSWEQLKPKLPQLKARKIVLSHLGVESRRSLHRSVPRGVKVADDGMVVRL